MDDQHLLIDVPNSTKRLPCPADGCGAEFRLWERSGLTEHLKHEHRGLLIQLLRDQDLHAEASAIAALP